MSNSKNVFWMTHPDYDRCLFTFSTMSWITERWNSQTCLHDRVTLFELLKEGWTFV